MEEGCDSVVHEAWEGEMGSSIREKVETMVNALDTWSREVLGDLEINLEEATVG